MPQIGLHDKTTPTTPSTRFNSTSELVDIVAKMQKLRKKERQLAEDAINEGPDTKSQLKYAIITQMLEKLEPLITKFNETDEPILDLVTKMLAVVKPVLEEKGDTLDEMRNNNRRYANTATKASIIGSTALSVLSPAVSFASGALSLGLSIFASNNICDKTGLTETHANSYVLVKSLVDELSGISENLTKAAEFKISHS